MKPNSNHPKIRIKLSQGDKRDLPLEAMIDSGSAITTISPNTVKQLGLRTTPTDGNIQIRNADGSLTKGGWTKNVTAWIDTGVTRGRMEIAVLDTHEDQFMLGND